jgi:hypothetical protein
MSYIQMRTIPGLFIGRRTLIRAEQPDAAQDSGFRCGACESVIHPACDPEALREVVVICGCGEVNQL